MGYDNLKLEKGMYRQEGMNFTQVLESLDPSENYRGTALEGTDAFQRQLKRFGIRAKGAGSSPVEKFFRTMDSAVLFPEYIARTVRQGMEENDILPAITGGAWNTMVFRTFFKGLPETLFEAAYLDGASELRIFFSVVLPLSTPVFASLGFMALVARWNDYTTSMIYIRNESLYTLQYLLQRMMDQAEFMKNLANNPMMSGSVSLDTSMLPSESLKFAMCVIAAGPMLVVFPFFQKYFAQGLTIGAVKG